MNKFISVLLAVLLFATNAFGAVTISWPSAVVDANHDAAVNYDVRRKSGTGNYVSIAVITGTSYTDSLASDPGGITYTYQVFAQNGGGSVGSNEVSITTPVVTPPPGTSPNNARVPPLASITDNGGNVWTLGAQATATNRYVMKNNTYAEGAHGSVIVWCNGLIYTYDPSWAPGYWFYYQNNRWSTPLKTMPCP